MGTPAASAIARTSVVAMRSTKLALAGTIAKVDTDRACFMQSSSADGPSRKTQSQPSRASASTASTELSAPSKMVGVLGAASALPPLDQRALGVEVHHGYARRVLRGSHRQGGGKRGLTDPSLRGEPPHRYQTSTIALQQGAYGCPRPSAFAVGQQAGYRQAVDRLLGECRPNNGQRIARRPRTGRTQWTDANSSLVLP